MYFAYADDISKADYIGQIGKSERGIMEATTIIKTMSEDDAAFFREFSRDKAIRDYNAGISAAKRKGLEQGMQQGAQQKAIEDAVMIVKKYKATPEAAAQDAGAPLDKVLEALAAQPAPAQA